MGQLYSKLNQLVMNDVDTALDPDRPREKLETAFTTPARPFLVRLPDPRSASHNVDRTPILVPATERENISGTPKSSKAPIRRCYLETDLDDVIGNACKPFKLDDVVTIDVNAEKTEADLDAENVETSDTALDVNCCNKDEDALREQMTTSTPFKSTNHHFAAIAVVESVIDEVLNATVSDGELRFSDTAHVEIVTTELTDDGLVVEDATSEQTASDASCVDEIIVTFRDVSGLTEVESLVDSKVSDSLVGNWSGVGECDRSLGLDFVNHTNRQVLNLETPTRPSPSVTIRSIIDDSELDSPLKRVHVQLNDLLAQEDVLEDSDGDRISELPPWRCVDVEHRDLSESLVVHNDSTSLMWETSNAEDDSLLVSSPIPHLASLGGNLRANKMSTFFTPQRVITAPKSSGRTPLGDMSTNSPIRHQQLTLLTNKGDERHWKNAKDVRHKLGLDAENTPPHSSVPPTSVQSAPGKIRSKTGAAKWANDSIVI